MEKPSVPKTKFSSKDFLNLDDFNSTAAIFWRVRFPSIEERLSGNSYLNEGYVEFEISDCGDKISLSFPLELKHHENNLHKIDTMINSLEEFKKKLKGGQRRYKKVRAEYYKENGKTS